MPGSFLDSNVVVYFASADSAKAERSNALLRNGGTISVQVLNEVSSVGRRKMRLSWEELELVLAHLRASLTIEPVTVETHVLGIEVARRYQLSIYDSMLVAAALLSGCDTIWSEDMHDGLVIAGQLTVRNPFSGMD
jgi:predicted nucleic acid-binding protein